MEVTEELARDKQLLIDQHEDEKDRLLHTAQTLEEGIVSKDKAMEEKESQYQSTIDDLEEQVLIAFFCFRLF